METHNASSSKSTTSSSTKIIEVQGQEFRQNLNKQSFQFSHNLAEHPLFQIPRLVELAEFIEKEDSSKAYCRFTKNASINSKWSDPQKEPNVASAIANIDTSGVSVILQPKVDPEYDALIEQIIDELEIATGVSLRKEISWLGAYIFMGSPDCLTGYHIDHECNFLFQIHGEKEDYVFDGSDRSVITEEELEHFYKGDIEKPNFREENRSKATVYRLTPGVGVHHPVVDPHWVKTTRGSYAITFSVLFYMKSYDVRARVYQANYCLRQLGFQPTPPDKSPLLDKIKINLIGLFSNPKPAKKYDIVRSGIYRILSPFQFGKKVIQKLKKLPKRTINRIPVVSDYYNYYWSFPRRITAYRGVYNTFSEALESLPSSSRISHNQADIHENSAIAELTSCRKLGKLDSIDTPLIPWLKLAFNDSSTVFDLGGNVGVSYYAFKQHLYFPENLRWTVCEVPEIAKAGEKIAEENNSLELSFTTEFTEADGTDIFLSCGTLQYIEPSLSELLTQLKKKPKHLLINYVPFYDGEPFVTLQNIGYAYSPYKIQNKTEFINSLVSLGYEYVAGWASVRICSIPFHKDRTVREYSGFYLKAK